MSVGFDRNESTRDQGNHNVINTQVWTFSSEFLIHILLSSRLIIHIHLTPLPFLVGGGEQWSPPQPGNLLKTGWSHPPEYQGSDNCIPLPPQTTGLLLESL